MLGGWNTGRGPRLMGCRRSYSSEAWAEVGHVEF